MAGLGGALRTAAGNVLVETGQVLQRIGLRGASHIVVMPELFQSMGRKLPEPEQGAEIDPSTTLVGTVHVQARSRFAENVVMRGEENDIHLGIGSSFGKNTVVTASTNRTLNGLPSTVEVGFYAEVGADCVLESCLVGNHAKIGDGCVLSAGSFVENNAVLDAGTVVPPLHRIPAHQHWGGNPAKYLGPAAAAH